MTQDDLKQIDALFDKRFKSQNQKFDKRFTESENRFDKKLENLEERLNQKIKTSADEVIEGIADMLNDSVFPKLSKMAEKSDIERVERRLDAISNEVGNHAVRIKAIEQIPAVAHELKRSKKK